MKRILLVQPGDIGDLIVTTPAIHALRQAHSQAHLTLLTTTHAAPVINNTGLVDQIVTFDRSGFNSSIAFFKPGNLRIIFGLGYHDTVIFFRHFTLKAGTLKFALIALAVRAKQRIGLQNGNGWFLTQSLPDAGFGAKHEAQYWLDLVSLLGADSSPHPTLGASEPYSLPESNGPCVIIHPGSGGYSPARRWNAEGFAAVADTLHSALQAQIIIVGGKNDNTGEVIRHMQHPPLDLTGKTSLPELAGVITQADLYIGADSGMMHLASTTGTPIVALFGPSNHTAWHPWTPQSPTILLRSAPECSPCSYVGHGMGLRDGCAARTCMRMITPEQVIAAARSLLNGENPPVKVQSQDRKLPPNQRVQILGLPVDAITYEDWLAQIDNWVKNGTRVHHVCTTNPEFTMIAQHDPNFAHILKRADLCIPDGVGLLWAAKRKGVILPQRVTGSDGVPIIAECAAEKGWKLFFLGAAPGIADQAANILKTRYPGLQIVGVYSGSPAPEEEDYIVELVNASGADILLVAYGAPQQDKWIARNTPRLQIKMAMGIGGAFDFIAGVIPRAPLWMRNAGIEWLYRLYRQPWRIRRIMRVPRFVLAVLLERST